MLNIKWLGLDIEKGLKTGITQGEGIRHEVNISVPGLAGHHKARVFIDGDFVGASDSLEGAVKIAAHHIKVEAARIKAQGQGR